MPRYGWGPGLKTCLCWAGADHGLARKLSKTAMSPSPSYSQQPTGWRCCMQPYLDPTHYSITVVRVSGSGFSVRSSIKYFYSKVELTTARRIRSSERAFKNGLLLTPHPSTFYWKLVLVVHKSYTLKSHTVGLICRNPKPQTQTSAPKRLRLWVQPFQPPAWRTSA